MTKRKLMRKQAMLFISIALSCIPVCADAVFTESVRTSSSGREMFDVRYYGEGTTLDPLIDENKKYTWTLGDSLKQGLNAAIQMWADILGPGAQNSKPVQMFVGTYNNANADAASLSYDGTTRVTAGNYLKRAMQNGM